MSNFNTAYSQSNHYFGAEPEAILVGFWAELDPAYPILDGGCGQGRNTFALARHPTKKFRVLAIDPSTTAIRTVPEIADAEQLAVLLFGLLQILPVETIRAFIAQTGIILFRIRRTRRICVLISHRTRFSSGWIAIIFSAVTTASISVPCTDIPLLILCINMR